MNVGVQFEILVDGKVLRCLEGCCDCLGRCHNPLSEVAGRDRKTGEITPVSCTPGII